MPTSGGFIDISRSLTPQMPVWPGDPVVRITPALQLASGDGVNVSRLELGSHTGTHVDAPFHFIESGQRVDQLALEQLIGPCWVADLTHAPDHIDAAQLATAGIPQGTRRLLLKTRNSERWHHDSGDFTEDFIGITPSGAEWLVAAGVRLVGIDYLSVEPFQGTDGRTHLTLLGAGIIAVEGLDLHAVQPGGYTLICLPLKIAGGDGAPCRAVLAPLAFGG